MDELRTRAQVLLEHPPIDPRPMAELRDQAGRRQRRRRRGRHILVALVTVGVVAAVAASLTVGRTGSHPTIHVGVPPVTTSTTGGASTTTTATTGAAPTYGPPVVGFADDTSGWLVAGGNCSNGRCADPIMRHTTDGGRTWAIWTSVPAVHQIPLDAPSQHDLGGLVLVAFADPQDGWYGQGGQLWSTHDGGRSWHHLDLGGVLALEPMGETAWALWARCPSSTTGLSAGQLSCPATLLSTPSALDAWTPADVATTAGGDLLAVGSTLWIRGGTQVMRSAVGQPVTAVAPPCAGEPGLSPDRLLDLGVGRIGVLCAAGAVDGNTNTMAKVVVQSTDGVHWTRFAVAPSTGWAGWAAGNGAGTALVVTDGHTLWRSTGGAWTPVFTPGSPTGEIDELTMVSASTGFLTADNGTSTVTVWATHDSGRTWDETQLH